MKKSIWFLLITLGAFTQSFGQIGFRTGYIVKPNGDSLNGVVFYGVESSFSRTCRFKRFDLAEEFSYSPGELKSYGFKNGRRFLSLTQNGKHVFMEILAEGSLSVFSAPGSKKTFLRFNDEEPYQLRKGTNRLHDGQVVPDYLQALYYYLHMANIQPDTGQEPEFTGSEIARYVQHAGRKSGRHIVRFAQTDRVHQLTDFSITPAKSLLKLSLYAGYQLVAVNTNQNKSQIAALKRLQYRLSYRPVAGVNATVQLSKLSDRLLLEFGAHYLKDTYYADDRYEYLNDIFYDDLILSFSCIQIPVGFRLKLGNGKTRPYLKAGGMTSILLDWTYKRYVEEVEGNEVYTSLFDDEFNWGGGKGAYGAAGVEKQTGPNRYLSLEAGYMYHNQGVWGNSVYQSVAIRSNIYFIALKVTL